MRVGRLVVVMLGCGGSRDAPTREPPTVDPLAKQAIGTDATDDPVAPPPPPPEFPVTTRSLTLTRTVGVRIEPGDGAKRIGTVAIDTRVGWVGTRTAKGCQKAWVEIRPRGWICGDYVKPST